MGKRGSWFCTVKKALSLQTNKDEKTQKSKKKSVNTSGGVNRVTSTPRYLGESVEEIAAVRIQIVFRGYLARKALRSLKALKRLKSFIKGYSLNQQATTTLICMRTLARARSRTRTRQNILSEQNRALEKQLQHRHEKEMQKLKSSMGGDWNVSAQSKEQIEAKQQYRQKAAMLREKALAYSFTHQRSWKNPLKPVNQAFLDSDNPLWNWSWLERWMAARPWEIQRASDNKDSGTVKSIVIGITKGNSQGYLDNDYNKRCSTQAKSTQPSIRRSSSTPQSKAHPISPVASKIRFPCTSPTHGNMPSRHKRHSIGGLTVSDDETFTSSPRTPSNKMSPKGQSRSPSNGTPERGPPRSLKKRLSFPSSSF